MRNLLLAFVIALGLSLSHYASAYTDPTRPSGYSDAKVEAKTQWRLESVLISRQRKVAVINGGSYQEGDQVGRAKLIRIEQNRVTMRKGSRNVYLELFEGDVKQISGN